MARHDEAERFIRVGRIEIGRATLAPTAEPAGMSLSIPFRNPRGAVECLTGTGPDLAAAVVNATVRALAAGGFLQMRLLSPGARDVETSTEAIVQGIGGLFPTAPLPPETIGAIREIVSHELNRFGEGQAILAAPATAIPWIVRLFENPQGWLRLHGAVNLKDHDMIHVLLGRGLQIDANRLPT